VNYPTVNYPFVTYPETPTYPSTSYSGGGYSYPYAYSDYSTPIAYAATTPSYVTPTAYAATPTGPVNDILWTIAIGLPLSAAIYLIIFRIRFRGRPTLAEAYRATLLERKIRKIKKAEIKSDAYVFQS